MVKRAPKRLKRGESGENRVPYRKKGRNGSQEINFLITPKKRTTKKKNNKKEEATSP